MTIDGRARKSTYTRTRTIRDVDITIRFTPSRTVWKNIVGNIFEFSCLRHARIRPRRSVRSIYIYNKSRRNQLLYRLFIKAHLKCRMFNTIESSQEQIKISPKMLSILQYRYGPWTVKCL